MTSEQFGTIVTALSNAPAQILFAIALNLVYRDLRLIVVSLAAEIAATLEQHREMVSWLMEEVKKQREEKARAAHNLS